MMSATSTNSISSAATAADEDDLGSVLVLSIVDAAQRIDDADEAQRQFGALVRLVVEQPAISERVFRDLFQRLVDAKRIEIARSIIERHYFLDAGSRPIDEAESESAACSALLASLVRKDQVDVAHNWFDTLCAKRLARTNDCVQLFVLMAKHYENCIPRLNQVLRYVDETKVELNAHFFNWIFTVLFTAKEKSAIIDVYVYYSCLIVFFRLLC